jgi:hypothetical protein
VRLESVDKRRTFKLCISLAPLPILQRFDDLLRLVHSAFIKIESKGIARPRPTTDANTTTTAMTSSATDSHNVGYLPQDLMKLGNHRVICQAEVDRSLFNTVLAMVPLGDALRRKLELVKHMREFSFECKSDSIDVQVSERWLHPLS